MSPSSSSPMTFDDFFKNLPILAFSEVCKHVPLVPLTALLLNDEKWEIAISRCSTNVRQKSIVDISVREGVFTLKMDLQNGNEYDFCCKEGTDEEIVTSSTSLHFHSNSSKTVQNTFSKLLLVLLKMHPPTYKFINVNTELRSESDFVHHLLSRIPKGNAKCVDVRSSGHKVGKEDYLKFVKNISAQVAMESRVELEGEVEKREDILLLSRSYMEIDDARFMSHETMKFLNCESGDFYKSLLNSEDFREFLKSWKMGNNENLEKWQFTISDDQSVDIEKIVKGMDAKPWDPAVRDRVLIEEEEHHFGYMFHWDMKNGLDMVNINGKLGTICLIDKVLIFGIWKRRFPMRYYEGEWNDQLARCEAGVQRKKGQKMEYERRLEEGGVVDKQLISWIDEDISREEKWIETFKGYLDMMNNEWR